eukprot:1189926-Prorocentrum_minimum.AAC.3
MAQFTLVYTGSHWCTQVHTGVHRFTLVYTGVPRGGRQAPAAGEVGVFAHGAHQDTQAGGAHRHGRAGQVPRRARAQEGGGLSPEPIQNL